MNSARSSQEHSLPTRISEVTNQKQKLHNDVIGLFEEKQLKWKQMEVAGIGNSFLRVMVDTLWYLDGHHHVLCKRGQHIPKSLQKYIGYNTPESSKHRKRTTQNLSEITLRELANRLFSRLQDTYWERIGWKDFKLDIKTLATSISDYASYLREQNKKTKYLQSQTEPVRSIANNLDLQFLPQCKVTPSLLVELESLLHEKDNFQHIVVEDVCPTDPRRKYDYLQALKSSGLAVQVAMLTYRHGNNIGNTNCIWKVPEQGPDSFSQSQQTIENIKEQIPSFHTRAMRQSLMQKYGKSLQI